MRPPTVVLSAHHKAYRDGLARAIRSRPGLDLVAVTDDAMRALGEVTTRRPRLCLMDIGLPPWDALEVCRRARELPGLGTLFVLMTSDLGAALDGVAREAGAAAVVSKEIPRAELCDLLVRVARRD